MELKESQGQLHRLKTAIAERRYLPTEQATAELNEFLETFKRFALNIPARVAANLAGAADAVTVRGVERSLRKELEAMLETFVDAAVQREERTEE